VVKNSSQTSHIGVGPVLIASVFLFLLGYVVQYSVQLNVRYEEVRRAHVENRDQISLLQLNLY